jgi:ornithine carbamoyltransferase
MLRALLRTSDLTPADLECVLVRAERFRREPKHACDLLRGESAVLCFDRPSTRTRISFETALARLGGLPIAVGPAELQLGRGETIEDTARVISRYARVFVIRTGSDADVARFARAASIPVINALTDMHHPCQSAADLLTLRQKLGDLRRVKLAYLGDGNNVAHSLIEACALAGVQLALATPPSLAPDPGVVAGARALAQVSGARIELFDRPEPAVAGAHAVYTDAWLSMGDPEQERAARHAALRAFRVDARIMGLAREHALFMHCLPDHRGEEVTAEVVDGPQSVVFDQAENRLHTALAIVAGLVEGQLVGRA